MTNVEDATLVRRTREGSQDAFRELVLRYQDPIFALLVRMVRNRDLAADLAQETFLKAYRFLDSFDTSRSLKSWLFKVAHNTAIDHLRRSEPDTVALETPDEDRFDPVDRLEDVDSGDPHRTAEARELARALDEAFGELDPLYREILELRFRHGLAYDEIAEITGLPMGTVKVRIHRGRKRLAGLLEDRGWSP